MNERVTPECDWADVRSLEIWPAAQLTPGNTVAAGCRAIADALREAEARGYRDARRPYTLFEIAKLRTPEDDAAFHAEAIAIGQRNVASGVCSPREQRERYDDCQRDHLQAIDEREPWVAA